MWLKLSVFSSKIFLEMSPEALKGDGTSEAKTAAHNHCRNERVEKTAGCRTDWKQEVEENGKTAESLFFERSPDLSETVSLEESW